nr:hypothetical protein [Tanacetum cinerariifolium]
YALTISPTVYVSHIRQFWSTARVETTNQGTKILATVVGKPRTMSESSLRRHLKLNDEEGISSFPDTELFENLSLMSYNILPNQRFTFQKGQFSHQKNSMEATNILTSEVVAVSVSPVAAATTAGVPTVNGLFPTASVIFTTASVVTPYTRRSREISSKDKGKEKVVESEDVSEEDLKGMMQLVPLKEVYVEALQVMHPIINWEIHSEGQREYWKIIRLGGHTTVYQFFVDMLKQFDIEDLHQLWTLVKETLRGHTTVYQFFVDMLKQFDIEDLHQLWTLVKETLSIRQATKDKEKELWVELKRLFKPDFEDQLCTHNQAFMHDPLEWKLYDTCGGHHVFTKDQEMFILVEKDYPLRKGLVTLMICNKIQVEQYS